MCKGVQGAEAALQALARRFGTQLPQKLPRLWEAMSAALELGTAPAADAQVCVLQRVYECVQLYCLASTTKYCVIGCAPGHARRRRTCYRSCAISTLVTLRG